MMEKRSITIGEYNTADYGWTLGSWKLTDPEQKTNYVEKTGGDGSWDLSTVMTGGIPRYKDRTLTVPLELSQGTREDREEVINAMVNQLDGLEWRIVLPDRPDYYLVGRVHIAVEYSDLAHAKVVITAIVAETLSIAIVTEIIGVIAVYMVKSFLETSNEKKHLLEMKKLKLPEENEFEEDVDVNDETEEVG